jgi:hypothetical protein
VRIHIPDRQGDAAYFGGIRETLTAPGHKLARLQANPLTATVLLEAEGMDVDGAARLGREAELWDLTTDGVPQPMVARAAEPFETLSQRIQGFTGDEVDLPSLIFTGLVSIGVFQLLRGKLVAPPWYTAFWYASGVFARSMGSKKKRG